MTYNRQASSCGRHPTDMILRLLPMFDFVCLLVPQPASFSTYLFVCLPLFVSVSLFLGIYVNTRQCLPISVCVSCT